MKIPIDKMIDRLRGTCNEPFPIEDYTLEDLAHLDEEIFQCVDCGWWCDISELSAIPSDECSCTDCEGL